jgi:hypothetical protein
VLSAMVLTQCACSESVRINLPYHISIPQGSTKEETDIDSGPDFDGSITTSSIDHSFSSPADDIDTRSVSSQDKFKSTSSGVPYSDSSVLGSSCQSWRGGLFRDQVEGLESEGSDPFTVPE